MSTHKTKQIIKKEIKKLNETIDIKIIKGLPYRNESRRHKFLVSQLSHLSHLRSPRQMRWYERPLRLVSTFLF